MAQCKAWTPLLEPEGSVVVRWRIPSGETGENQERSDSEKNAEYFHRVNFLLKVEYADQGQSDDTADAVEGAQRRKFQVSHDEEPSESGCSVNRGTEKEHLPSRKSRLQRSLFYKSISQYRDDAQSYPDQKGDQLWGS